MGRRVSGGNEDCKYVETEEGEARELFAETAVRRGEMRPS